MTKASLFFSVTDLIRKTLLEQDAAIYNGRTFPMTMKAQELAEKLIDMTTKEIAEQERSDS